MSGTRHNSACSPHEAWVQTLVRDGARTTGFRRTLLERVEESDAFPWLTIVPDAYEVSSSGLVLAYEVEDTHRLTPEKLEVYARLWSELDERGLELRLVVIDIRGGRWEPSLETIWFSIDKGSR